MSDKITHIEFNAKALAPLSLFMATHDIRYYLNGMYVAPHPNAPGCIITATDGHRIAYWYDKTGVCTEAKIVKVSAGLISAARRKSRYNKDKTIRLVYGRLVLIEGGFDETFVQAGQCEIDAKYPDVWKLIPKQEDLKPGLSGCCINPKYVRDLGDVARMIGGNARYSAMQYFQEVKDDGNWNKIVTLYDGIDHDFMVITMPMSGDCKLPDAFFTTPAPEQKPEAPKKKPARAKAKGGAA